MRQTLVWLSISTLLVLGSVLRGDEPAPEDWFEQEVRPVLTQHCLKCHGETKQEGGLRLDSREAMLTGGESGAAVVPSDISSSLLVEAIRYESLEMPPDAPLDDAEQRVLVEWIEQGAVWPEHVGTIREPTASVTDSDRQWWSFLPVERAQVPILVDDHWSRNEIDRFVLDRMRKRGIQPAPQADRATLIRRLYFDLIGLPPTPEQVNAFVNDNSPDAWERLIDSLLASDKYGENWARAWLDVVRYAESDGWKQDAFRPHIWRYRDYVVRSFNIDRPFPEFVMQQLAGDEMTPSDPENLVATGFLRLGIYEYNQRNAQVHWNDIINEITDVTGDAFLGMGMACARCHDHKFDPVLQRDYYQLRAFFEPVIWRDDLPMATREQLAEHERQARTWKQATAEIRHEIDALIGRYYDEKERAIVDKFPLEIQACYRKPAAERTSWETQMAYLVTRQISEEGDPPLAKLRKNERQRYDELQQQLAAFDHLKPAELIPMMTASGFEGPIVSSHLPSDPEGAPILPGFLTVLCSAQDSAPSEPARLTRTDLAHWIASADNPLTTRVFVNRIWQQHFGEGIVASPNDFGHRGQAPTHPELLDWLVTQFIDGGWRAKPLHKLILMSATWQQSARHPQAAFCQQEDPQESLQWRAKVRRLSAEQIRDAMLQVSGQLDETLGGPSVAHDQPRRSLYLKSFRNTPHELLASFDAANGLKSVAIRDQTTTPTQSLLMINGDFPLTCAAHLAKQLESMSFATTAEQVDYAFQLVWGRPATRSELADTLAFLSTTADAAPDVIPTERMADLAHVLLNSSEFLYVD